jgi:hypothetical protein
MMFWSAFAALVFALLYAIPAVVGLIVKTPDPWAMVMDVAPSLFLGLSFVPLVAAWHVRTDAASQAWSMTAMGFATGYTTLVTFVYLVQLGIVAPAEAAGDFASVKDLTLAPGTVMTGADAMGYVLQLLALGAMGLSMRPRSRLERWTRVALLSNLFVAPGVALTVAVPLALVWGALWLVSVPVALGLVMALALRPASLRHRSA